jgi:hypothetical protein
VVKRTGDGVDAAFFDTSAALRAAVDAQLALVGTAWPTSPPVRARMAIHLGPVLERDGDYYFGMPPNMAARLRDAGHGRQVPLSAAGVQEVEDLAPDDVRLVSLGVHRLRGIPGEHGIYEVLHPDLPQRFPPLRTLDAAAAVAVPATSFCGRDEELAALSTLAERPGTVTLVGPGGAGKTRLASLLEGGGDADDRRPRPLPLRQSHAATRASSPSGRYTVTSSSSDRRPQPGRSPSKRSSNTTPSSVTSIASAVRRSPRNVNSMTSPCFTV